MSDVTTFTDDPDPNLPWTDATDHSELFAETLSMLKENGWRAVPLNGNFAAIKRYGKGQTYYDLSDYQGAAGIGVVMDGAVLTDYDGNKANPPLLGKLAQMLEWDDMPEVRQSNNVGTSLHFLHRIEGDYPYQSNDGLTIEGVDFKRGNQLMNLKPNKVITDNEIPPVEDLPLATKAMEALFSEHARSVAKGERMSDPLDNIAKGQSVHASTLQFVNDRTGRGDDLEAITAELMSVRAALEHSRGKKRATRLFNGELKELYDSSAAYREKQAAEAVDSFNDEGEPDPVTEQSPINLLRSMSAANHLERLREMVSGGDYVLEDMVPEGTISLFFGKPNAGKTLMLLGFLCSAIRNGGLEPDRLIYINEDDNLEGYATKAEIAGDLGFVMLNSMYDETGVIRGPDDIVRVLYKLSQTEDCRGVVVLVDTLKKFCSLMDKDKTKRFFQIMRSICHAGGTVILLGHANKHLDADGNLVFEGVQDIQNDIDIMYALQCTTDRQEPKQQVTVTNRKDRGKVTMQFAFSYEKDPFGTYADMLSSVTLQGADEADRILQRLAIRDAIDSRSDEWMFIRGQLLGGFALRTNMVDALASVKNPNGVTKKSLNTTLAKLVRVGLLTKKHDRTKNNASVYRLDSRWNLDDF